MEIPAVVLSLRPPLKSFVWFKNDSKFRSPKVALPSETEAPRSMVVPGAISTVLGSKFSFIAVFCALPGPNQTKGENALLSTKAKL